MQQREEAITAPPGHGSRHFRILPVLVLCCAAALLAQPAGVSAQDIFAGRKVYEENCANCHGFDGRATLTGVPDFDEGTGLYASDADLIKIVRFGKNLMPGYDWVLKESEILNVISYVRTLRR